MMKEKRKLLVFGRNPSTPMLMERLDFPTVFGFQRQSLMDWARFVQEYPEFGTCAGCDKKGFKGRLVIDRDANTLKLVHQCSWGRNSARGYEYSMNTRVIGDALNAAIRSMLAATHKREAEQRLDLVSA